MTHRLTTAFTTAALLLAAFALARPLPAQSPAGKGLFATLKIGQMVELAFDDGSTGYTIRTYEDPANKGRMLYKVTELQDDHITLHLDPAPNPNEMWDVRIPTHSLMAIFHVRQVKKK